MYSIIIFNIGSKKNAKFVKKKKNLLYRHHCSKHCIHVQCKMNQIPFQLSYFLPDLRGQLIFLAEILFDHFHCLSSKSLHSDEILPADSSFFPNLLCSSCKYCHLSPSTSWHILLPTLFLISWEKEGINMIQGFPG